MAYDKNGKGPKVKDRWYGDHKYRQRCDLTPRELKGDPQFKLDDLYITPFIRQRRYSADGLVSYVPIERDLKLTGICIMDDFLRSLTTGHADIATFCKPYGARTSDIDSIIFLFTGMRGVDFRQAYQFRLSDDLLRYTSLPRCRCCYMQWLRFPCQPLLCLSTRSKDHTKRQTGEAEAAGG